MLNQTENDEPLNFQIEHSHGNEHTKNNSETRKKNHSVNQSHRHQSPM